VNDAPVTVRRFLDRLSGVHPSGAGWSASCPCRDDDRNPSLTVGVGGDGQVLVKCHRGVPCTLDEICRAVGLEPHQLFPEDDTPWSPPPRPSRPQPPARPPVGQKAPVGTLEDTYDYVDADGTLVMQVLRYRRDDGGKTFRQRCPDGHGGWLWSTQHLTERPLYRLPAVLAAVADGTPVWVVEGEKDVHALEAAGRVATCNPMGADNGSGNKWRPEHTAALAGAKVWVVADRDDAGTVHARHVAAHLGEAGARVRLRTVPSPHKDVHDLLSAGGSLDDLVGLGTPDGAGPDVPADDPVAPEGEDTPHDPVADVRSRILEVLDDRRMPADRRLSKAQRLLEDATSAAPRRENPGRVTTWRELTSEADQGYEWLIPGVLERGERVMIVAAEGVGKTMLARQVAICCAAGVHPFTYSRMPAVNTLFVDLENPERIIRRTARRIVDEVDRNWPGREHAGAHLWVKPDGIDVLKARDRDRLEEVVERARPDLLVMGPIYKMFVDPGNRSTEAVTVEVATYLDRIRELYGCALWLEHHAPLGNSLSGRDLRPMGSAVWMRWPEFGYALAPDPTAHTPEYEVKQWRGPRDDRAWPARLRRGTVLPFEVVT
jgi:hypothetical protein